MASGDRTIAFTEEQLEDLSETFETVLGERKTSLSYLERLPSEIIEKILLNVPTSELPLNEPWICKTLSKVIWAPQFWINKLKSHGLIIEDKIWAVLHDCKDYEMVSCLHYASLYQEHCIKQTPIAEFFLEVPEPTARDNWFIFDDLDNAMLMASGVLVYRDINNSIVLCLDEKENITSLPLFLKLVEARGVNLDLKDSYAFWNFHPRINYFQFLKSAGGKNKVLDHFIGCLTTLEGCPIEMYEPRIAIAVNDQNVAIDPGFSHFSQSSDMWIHLKAGSDISNLPKISSDHKDVRLLISGMEESHILWMIEVANKLLNKVHALAFSKYQLNFESSKYLLNIIAKSGLEIADAICLSSPIMGDDQEELLTEVANDVLGDISVWILNSQEDLVEHIGKEYDELVWYCR